MGCFMKKIATFFANAATALKTSRSTHKQFIGAMRAIRAGHAATDIAAMVGQVQFSSYEANHILIAAIHRDDVAVFDTVLGGIMNGNVNHVLHMPHASGPAGPYGMDSRPILSYAIANKAKNIAAHLARNPQTDIFQRDRTSVTRYVDTGLFLSGRLHETTTAGLMPYELALRNDMQDVARVMRARIVAGKSTAPQSVPV